MSEKNRGRMLPGNSAGCNSEFWERGKFSILDSRFAAVSPID